MKHVIMSVGSVLMVVRTGILVFSVTTLVAKILTGGIVLVFVLLIVIHVDTQMDCVLVKPGGWIQIAAQNAHCLMEKIVGIHAAYTASIRPVTDLMELACSVVLKEKNAIKG